MHGTTIHGLQRVDPPRCDEALGYYHARGPAAQVMDLGPAKGRRVAIAGLGTGGLGAYARAGDRWTFYEIDPAVKRIATDPKLFCYLPSMRVPHTVRLGDARLALAADSTVRYDLLVLDAYSSDAIPVHLLTREAIELYRSRLAPGGVMALHISNRNFDLAPVVANLARDAGLVCHIRNDREVSAEDFRNGAVPSEWAVLAESESALGPLAADARWRTPPAYARVVWTDDYSSLVSVLR
jgi:spermidine synthase